MPNHTRALASSTRTALLVGILALALVSVVATPAQSAVTESADAASCSLDTSIVHRVVDDPVFGPEVQAVAIGKVSCSFATNIVVTTTLTGTNAPTFPPVMLPGACVGSTSCSGYADGSWLAPVCLTATSEAYAQGGLPMFDTESECV